MQNLPAGVMGPPAGRTVAAARDFVINLSPLPAEPPDALFSRLALEVRKQRATLLALFIFGDIGARAAATGAMRRFLGPIDWPVLWVEGHSCAAGAIAGLQAFALRGGEVERLLIHGSIVGTVFNDGGARHCLVAGVGPDTVDIAPERQARQTFENLRSALGHADFGFRDIARTWFYNERLLDWYSAFNVERNRFYAEEPFRSGAVPASTGIEARNPDLAALAVAAWAVQPLDADARVRPVVSPLQCSAQEYGSAFSRAMEIESGGRRRLLVSGTASIAPDGRSLWAGDIEKQIATTMDVVAAILQSRRMNFRDVTRATAYFKHPLDVAAFEAWQAQQSVRLPAIHVHSDICRDDLLFELEVDAETAV